MYQTRFVFACGHKSWAMVEEDATTEYEAHPLHVRKLAIVCPDCVPIAALLKKMREKMEQLKARGLFVSKESTQKFRMEIVEDPLMEAGVRIQLVSISSSLFPLPKSSASSIPIIHSDLAALEGSLFSLPGTTQPPTAKPNHTSRPWQPSRIPFPKSTSSKPLRVQKNEGRKSLIPKMKH